MPAYPRGWDAERLQKLAGELHEVACKPNEDGTLSRWLHGPKYTDIFVDFAPGGNVVRVEVSFGGHYFLWDGETYRTGLTDEMENHSGGMPASRFIREHTGLDEPIVRGARTLVESIADRFLADSVLSKLPPV